MKKTNGEKTIVMCYDYRVVFIAFFFFANLSVVSLGNLFTWMQQMHLGIHLPVLTNFCFGLLVLKMVIVELFFTNLSVASLGDLFTWMQQMHLGIQLPVLTNFCFGLLVLKMVIVELFFTNQSVASLGDLFTWMQQIHLGIHLPVLTNVLFWIISFENGNHWNLLIHLLRAWGTC